VNFTWKSFLAGAVTMGITKAVLDEVSSNNKIEWSLQNVGDTLIFLDTYKEKVNISDGQIKLFTLFLNGMSKDEKRQFLLFLNSKENSIVETRKRAFTILVYLIKRNTFVEMKEFLESCDVIQKEKPPSILNDIINGFKGANLDIKVFDKLKEFADNNGYCSEQMDMRKTLRKIEKKEFDDEELEEFVDDLDEGHCPKALLPLLPDKRSPVGLFFYPFKRFVSRHKYALLFTIFALAVIAIFYFGPPPK
jgi:hypothetical protein